MDLTLHHVGILTADIAQSAAQYAERFGYRVCSEIIHDPAQTARVQFLSLADSAPFVELVTPDGPKSKLSNALKKGGGLNHLCYLAPAIEEECRRMRELGMLLLQSPVEAAAFPGRRIAWLMGRDGIPIELLEPGQGAL
ncbi:MAG: VOC family protein [Pirellulales bacterium]|nr:VOC family protein [Pirellulales bacterium]